MVATEVHPEAQYQNPAPIKPQRSMPAGVHDMELSWDRNEGYMRVVIGSDKWWFKELLGRAIVLGTENETGRINLRAKAQLSGERVALWRPSTAEPHPRVAGVSYPASHQRLCYRRAGRDWRLRDERKTKSGDPNALVFVNGYIGDLAVEWSVDDVVAHIYHQGPWTLCRSGCIFHKEGGYAHFYL
jgi:hypothetical protein